MMCSGFLLLLLLTELWGNERYKIEFQNYKKFQFATNCSFQSLLMHLNVTKNNELFTLYRPVKKWNQQTIVTLKMWLYAILDVRETDQTFIPYVWIDMHWRNEHIEWEPKDFCDIKNITVPIELLWKPDLTIEEMTEKDKAPPAPYLTIKYNGSVEMRNDQVLVSTCRMQVYKFPFDTQRCNLTFKSLYTPVIDELRLHAISNTSKITNWSRQVMGKECEWLLISVDAAPNTTNNFEYEQSVVVYTISMRRRSALYIINFILPVLFLLCLDFASFLISDSGGEKLGFKVTVLLAVTVMQLILNEILPASSDRIPLIDAANCQDNCSYQDVLNYLNLTMNNELFIMTRPVKNYKQPTYVSLEVLLYAILDVVEKEQKFIPYVWTVTRWHNDFISWDPNQFCGIDNVSVPTEILWKPDLTIEEMTEKDKAPPSPYLTISDKGDVEVQNDQVLVSTCRMHTYNFPFDIQSCNLSFKSVIHTAKDLRLQPSDNSSEATEWSREVMRTQYEWLFINMTVTANNASDPLGQDIVVYTITMKRRSVLYIANFLLPVLFFLCLDLASFLISDRGGEKLSFKVTVLLAVTVLQLILNEILPSSSNNIPLIAVYCIGIFALMMLSLFETIFVMYLMEKDSASESTETAGDQSLSESCDKPRKVNFYSCKRELQKWIQSACVCDLSADETPSEPLPVAEEDNSTKLREEYHALEKLSDELKAIEKTLALLLNSRKEEEKPGYWTRLAKRLNKVFFIFYVTMVSLFLVFIFLKWNIA
ncbi:hypothetical protein Q5P01_023555 [Channa striata]|uniref:5-hydroxytryptamine receptor 3A-like n=1 Tax=Channa striata TaxID=64152 RepID=A0AA88LR07_CHASR|nr:hypothetical protein Q5P01_023555 [Channa striata]